MLHRQAVAQQAVKKNQLVVKNVLSLPHEVSPAQSQSAVELATVQAAHKMKELLKAAWHLP